MVARQHRDRGKLSGQVGRQLARDLALGDQNQTQLADKYGVTTAAITFFKQRRAEEIAAIAAEADNEYAGMWIAQKQARLAEYERIHGIALEPTPKVAANGKVVQWVNPESGAIETIEEVDGRLAAQVLKQAAEEMGQLPTRLQVSGEMGVTTTYRVEGVDPKDLQ